jgi:galactokinase
VLAAILTLLGLIIGFTFSMGLSRYDLRKNYEQAEANAIGTEFVRADLLPAADAQRARVLLTNYVDLRIRYYVSQDDAELRRLKEQTNGWRS